MPSAAMHKFVVNTDTQGGLVGESGEYGQQHDPWETIVLGLWGRRGPSRKT